MSSEASAAGPGGGALPEFAGEDRAEDARAASAAFSALLGMPTARFTPFEVCRRASRSAERCELVAPVPSAEAPPDITLPPPPPPPHVVSLALAPDAAGYVGIHRGAPPPPFPRFSSPKPRARPPPGPAVASPQGSPENAPGTLRAGPHGEGFGPPGIKLFLIERDLNILQS